MKHTSLLILLLTIALFASAQTPRTLNFQGNLTDPVSGDIVADGDYPMTVHLYDVLTGGTALWTEDLGSITVINGIFNVKLGKNTPLDPSLFADSLWLEIVVNSETLSPRIELASSAYSFSASSLVGDNFIPNSGNVHIGGNLDVGGVAPTIDLAIDDDDTGLEVPADGTLQFYTDGIGRMVIENTGDIGIGVSDPLYKLDVAGDINTTGDVIASDFVYSNPKTEYLFIPSFQFKIAVNSPTLTQYLSGYDRRYLIGGSAGNSQFIIAPFNLPHNSTITSVTLFTHDSDASYDITQARLYSNGVGGGYPISGLALGAGSTTGSSGDQPLTSTFSITVNNTNQGLWLYFYMPQGTTSSSISFYGARVTYTTSEP